MKKIAILAPIVFVTGPSINHPLVKDCDAPLIKYPNETTLPEYALEANCLIDKKTAKHRYQFRAATVGYAHVWIVELGKILDKTLLSDYVQSGFRLSQKETQTVSPETALIVSGKQSGRYSQISRQRS